MEAAYNDSGRMHDKTSFNKCTVNRVSSAVNVKLNFVNSKTKTVCGRCTGNHKSSDCPYISKKCYNCGKIGHIVAGCRQPKQNKSSSSPYQQGRFKSKSRKVYGPAHCVEDDESDNIDNEAGTLFGVKHGNNGRNSKTINLDVVHPEIKVEMSILGETVNFTVDTAESVTVISEDLYFEMFSDVPMDESNAILRGFSGSVIPVVEFSRSKD
ncbi:hypothetical protein LOTGIDRAFT_157264 [Lottia gigantea]|uniref:CCHC-type domain-containing protein n=1 Tax=Lottia gigantea TaxID=225164 RepID=V4B3X8_LOTGI|nr:hypothetical protein LOTGIDRAFT_157264 [Lottia gigantea]ESP02116.1 hypothetical protein LOTGIDRAFT_157264 [Lottia gigantea]